MVEVTATVRTSPDEVFAVLADGWSYVGWVVGATHIRAVDPGWPAEGTRIHHSVGGWPLMAHDVTVVRAVEPPRMLELEARLWPFGTALVRLELTGTQPGVTEVRMSERALRGPAALLPEAAQAVLLVPRNRESLRRLADRAVGRHAPPSSQATSVPRRKSGN
jgi:hypothetical protein